jgi:hypothetical protein
LESAVLEAFRHRQRKRKKTGGKKRQKVKCLMGGGEKRKREMRRTLGTGWVTASVVGSWAVTSVSNDFFKVLCMKKQPFFPLISSKGKHEHCK